MFIRVITFGLLAAAFNAPVTQSAGSCLSASCANYKDINTLWCHTDSTYYCRCRLDASGTWVPQQQPCAGGTAFSFRQQTCVHQAIWKPNECPPVEVEEEVELVVLECSNSCGTSAEIARLACHPEPTRKKFCQCRPTEVERVFRTQPMPCASGTSFSYKRQTCVHDALWTDTCPDA
ncbi:uncharacterized protein LOC134210794 [Armigeres subalbatus]|uniref:uncharacterized protein LOC134210794 n=1 Tax=Armigeres subalbatus TaxID=124917 RepID=UPI002ED1B9E2